MFLNYVQTFTVFPGVMFKHPLTFTDSIPWALLTYSATYNVCDTLGRILAGKRSRYNLPMVFIMFCFRFVFCIFYLFLAKKVNPLGA